MRKFLAVLIALIILTGCQLNKKPEWGQLQINGQSLQVEIVKTPEQMAGGLSGRDSLCANCGMLFTYPDEEVRIFWMKNMFFPLDFIWIKDKEIVGIAQNVPIYTSDGQITTISSLREVNRILEVNSGWANQNNVKIGDIVSEVDWLIGFAIMRWLQNIWS